MERFPFYLLPWEERDKAVPKQLVANFETKELYYRSMDDTEFILLNPQNDFENISTQIYSVYATIMGDGENSESINSIIAELMALVEELNQKISMLHERVRDLTNLANDISFRELQDLNSQIMNKIRSLNRLIAELKNRRDAIMARATELRKRVCKLAERSNLLTEEFDCVGLQDIEVSDLQSYTIIFVVRPDDLHRRTIVTDNAGNVMPALDIDGSKYEVPAGEYHISVVLHDNFVALDTTIHVNNDKVINIKLDHGGRCGEIVEEGPFNVDFIVDPDGTDIEVTNSQGTPETPESD